MFQAYLSFVRRLYTKKYQAANKRLKNIQIKEFFLNFQKIKFFSKNKKIFSKR